jgi:anthranilate/para-aminobenzoate synthase component I
MDKKFFSLFYLPENSEFLLCDKPVTSYLFYKDFKLNLITAERTDSSIEELNMFLDQYKVGDSIEQPVVWHLYYDLGAAYVDLEKLVPTHKPIALFIKYEESKILKDINELVGKTKTSLNLKAIEYPRFKNYKERFEKIYNHLLAGDCYQANLTDGFYFKIADELNAFDFISTAFDQAFGRGAYSHATYIEPLGKLFLSNSPECLFEVKKIKDKFNIVSMPIKGTIKVNKNSERADAWNKLSKSKKDQGELFMITDLIRNDLSKVEFKKAVVRNKKLPLHVPGLVHQFSIVNSEINEETTLLKIVKALFPGGSITGAPKKRVIKILSEVETYNRGFYCGSTIIMHKQLKAASINIRSAVIDFTQKELFYGAGGAITLLSNDREEFDESYSKMESFLHFLKVDNLNKG